MGLLYKHMIQFVFSRCVFKIHYRYAESKLRVVDCLHFGNCKINGNKSEQRFVSDCDVHWNTATETTDILTWMHTSVTCIFIYFYACIIFSPCPTCLGCYLSLVHPDICPTLTSARPCAAVLAIGQPRWPQASMPSMQANPFLCQHFRGKAE